jgi:AcrR family transcriptional regulator
LVVTSALNVTLVFTLSRAERTHRRIVDAAIELHTTVGPFRTTISAVAARAGVQRLTVYRHFPRDEDLLRACVVHGWERFPPPDPSAWARVPDPRDRLRIGLGELYEYYGRVGDAFVVLVRDFQRVPLLAALNEPYFAKWEQMRDVLATGWRHRGEPRKLLLAALEHALDLGTWHSLVRQRGLADEDAIDLLAGLVYAASRLR